MKGKTELKIELLLAVAFGLVLIMVLSVVNAADPEGPNRLDLVKNETKNTTQAIMLNISGVLTL